MAVEALLVIRPRLGQQRRDGPRGQEPLLVIELVRALLISGSHGLLGDGGRQLWRCGNWSSCYQRM